MSKRLSGLALAILVALTLGWALSRSHVPVATAEEPATRADEPATKAGRADRIGEANAASWTTAVTPKPLGDKVKKGLAWLVEHQHSDGGWSQGEESPQMRGGVENFRDTPDVGDTCIAALALIRSGSTPREGPYRDAVAKAVRFVRAKVEASDAESLSVSDVRGTRLQMKLGPNIDTFLASLLLAEVKGRMPDEPGNKGVDVALNKVVGKIKTHQKADGTWDNQTGWAPILAQSMGGKGLNRAAQAGAMVPAEVLARTSNFAVARAAVSAPAAAPSGTAGAIAIGGAALARDASPRTALASKGADRSGSFAGGMMSRGFVGDGAAGVELYDRASSLGVLQDSVNTNGEMVTSLRRLAETSKDEAERDKARAALEGFERTKKAHVEATGALLARLDDAQFVAGFGSNGGEEFLSYMNISESLVVKGGLDWTRWDDAMASNLGRVQNGDGSWTGHHCITGRTFCTSTALLVLMADRTPVPASAKVGSGSASK